MNYLQLIFVYALLFILWITTGASNLKAGTPPFGNVLPDLVEKVQPGVVNISSTKFVKQYLMRGMPEFFGMIGIPEEHVQKQSSLGSGFIIDTDGYILTNYHVIEKADEIIVNTFDKRRLSAKIIGRDKSLDLALIQLKGGASVPNLKPVPLGSSEKTRTGESVFAIGNPFGLQHTVTSGIISAKNRTIGVGALDNFLQTDASINFGNSGGPLFNLNGEVIGINTAINGQGQLLSFAIPIDEAKAHLADLKKFGYIARAWLGILGESINPAIQYYYDLPADHGLVITRLAHNGPAKNAGLKAGDVILAMNNNEIHDRQELQRSINKVRPGDSVSLKISRNGMLRNLNLRLTPAPDTTNFAEGVL